MNIPEIIITACVGSAFVMFITFVFLLAMDDLRIALIKLIEALASRIHN